MRNKPISLLKMSIFIAFLSISYHANAESYLVYPAANPCVNCSFRHSISGHPNTGNYRKSNNDQTAYLQPTASADLYDNDSSYTQDGRTADDVGADMDIDY